MASSASRSSARQAMAAGNSREKVLMTRSAVARAASSVAASRIAPHVRHDHGGGVLGQLGADVAQPVEPAADPQTLRPDGFERVEKPWSPVSGDARRDPQAPV